MKPLIKWPGGKTREIKHIETLIPKYNRYIEPFVGGGAIFFDQQSSTSIINDVDQDLIRFYGYIKTQDPRFFDYLQTISDDWNSIYSLVEDLWPPFMFTYNCFREKEKRSLIEIKEHWLNWMGPSPDHPQTNLHVLQASTFKGYLHIALSSKISRIIALEKKHNTTFSQELMQNHLETAIRSAFYTMMRDEPEINEFESCARFYFIREFCYGSMFRFNKQGKFNIPYGGINYNKKNFQFKVDRLSSKEVIEKFRRTTIYNLDFVHFFDKVKPTKNDFIFFDPPYDTDFKDYGKNPFTRDDQKRLAELFADLPSKCIMIISKNDFIVELYQSMQQKNPKIMIMDFDKQYTYNVRGRNRRDTKYLLIRNF